MSGTGRRRGVGCSPVAIRYGYPELVKQGVYLCMVSKGEGAGFEYTSEGIFRDSMASTVP